LFFYRWTSIRKLKFVLGSRGETVRKRERERERRKKKEKEREREREVGIREIR
jgi:hypothetical protein